MAVAIEPGIDGPYSLTEILTITAGPNNLTSIDTAIIDAPEPATLPVLGAAFLMLGTIGLRRATAAGRQSAPAFG